MAEPPKFARVTALRALTSSVREIALEMVEPKALVYRPGQTIVLYAGMQAGRELKKQYTLASAPHEEGLRLCVKLIPDGGASRYLAGLGQGDQITFSGPAGKCTLPEPAEGDFLFCATGNGLAPIRGMLLSLLREEAPQGLLARLLGQRRKVRLLWGLRREADIFWREELLDALRARHPSFQYHICLSQPGTAWTGLRGRLTEHLAAQLKGLKTPQVFLIGNGAMIKAARPLLEGAGVPKEHISSEAFFTPKQGGT